MSAVEKKTEYESTIVPHPWWIAGAVVGFIVFAAAAMGLLYLFYLPAAHEAPLHVTRFAAPRLQIDPARDLEKVDKAQQAKLDRTTWRDRTVGTLTIPIEAAMAVIASRGADAYAPLPNAPKNADMTRPPGATPPSGHGFNPGAGRPDPMLEGK